MAVQKPWHWNIKIIKLERKCPYGNKWIDESEVLKKTNKIKEKIFNREKKAWQTFCFVSVLRNERRSTFSIF